MADRKELAMAVKAEISKGKATKAKLLELEDIKDARALGRVFSDLRFLGFYPVEGKKEIFKLLEEEEYAEFEEEEKKKKLEEKKAAAKKKMQSKTPPKVRFQNKLVRFNNAMIREKTHRFRFAQAPDNVIVKLRWNISQLQFQIAKIEYEEILTTLRKELEYDTNLEVAEAFSNGIKKEEQEATYVDGEKLGSK